MCMVLHNRVLQFRMRIDEYHHSTLTGILMNKVQREVAFFIGAQARFLTHNVQKPILMNLKWYVHHKFKINVVRIILSK